MKNFIKLIVVLLLPFSVIAQTDSVKYNWGVYGSNDVNVEPQDSLNNTEQKVLELKNVNNGKQGVIKVSNPIEIKTISEEIKAEKEPKFKGYRVQIMLSQDKNEVLKAQSEFLRYNKDVEVYIDRKAPNYRLRAGDFYNKFDAYAFQKQISEAYPNALVVSDDIFLPKLQEKEVESSESQNVSE